MKTDEGHRACLIQRLHTIPNDTIPTIGPNQFKDVPVESFNAYLPNMSGPNNTGTFELDPKSFDPRSPELTTPSSTAGINAAHNLHETKTALVSDRVCSCVPCVYLPLETEVVENEFQCRFSGCNYVSFKFAAENSQWWRLYCARLALKHEKTHFRHAGRFRCIEDRCIYTAERWSDFKRHYTAKHCLSPKVKFPCPEIDCKYSGDKGFIRKDKLKSHHAKVHEKYGKPEKRFHVSKPAAAGAGCIDGGV